MPRKIKLCGKTRTIRQRLDGRWELRFTNKGKTTSIYDLNQEKCIAKFKEAFKTKDKLTKNQQKYTLKTWLWEWAKTYKQPVLKPNSYLQIELCIRVHLLPNIENVSLNELKAIDIQKGLNRINSSRMKKYSYDTISSALKTARKLRLIKEDLAAELEPVKHKRKIGQALSREQQANFEAEIKGKTVENLFLFYLYTGTRKSEALNLKWSDIDFEKELLHIQGTKTEGSNRIIPLFHKVRNLLQNQPRKAEKVFTISNTAIKRQLDEIRMSLKNKEKGIDILKLHNLRHTASTRWHEAGISSKIIQKWLGHSNVKTTEQIYIHVLTDFEKDAIRKVNFDPISDPRKE